MTSYSFIEAVNVYHICQIEFPSEPKVSVTFCLLYNE